MEDRRLCEWKWERKVSFTGKIFLTPYHHCDFMKAKFNGGRFCKQKKEKLLLLLCRITMNYNMQSNGVGCGWKIRNTFVYFSLTQSFAFSLSLSLHYSVVVVTSMFIHSIELQGHLNSSLSIQIKLTLECFRNQCFLKVVRKFNLMENWGFIIMKSFFHQLLLPFYCSLPLEGIDIGIFSFEINVTLLFLLIILRFFLFLCLFSFYHVDINVCNFSARLFLVTGACHLIFQLLSQRNFSERDREWVS